MALIQQYDNIAANGNHLYAFGLWKSEGICEVYTSTVVRHMMQHIHTVPLTQKEQNDGATIESWSQVAQDLHTFGVSRVASSISDIACRYRFAKQFNVT